MHRIQLLLEQLDSFRQTGQWRPALDLCEKVFRESWSDKNPQSLREIILRTAFVYNAKGDRALAIEHFELALAVATLWEDDARAARALNGLGILRQRAGEIEAAFSYYVQAKERALAAQDRTSGGDIEVNMGILANIRGDLQEALQHYQKAYAEYEASGHRDRLAKTLNNIGMLYIDLCEFSHAAEALERALNISNSIGDLVTEGIVYANRAELFIGINDLEAARSACDEAFEIASRLNNAALKTEVLKFYGIIYRLTGKPQLAESHFRQALESASELQNPLVEAETQRELSLLLRSQERNKEALETLNRAHALFSSLRAKHEQADITRRFEQLEADFLSLVAKWGESIEAKDKYTRGHCQRVADYACAIASHAGLTDRELTWFRMGAFLHDVGKTEVPEEILNKPGKLTDSERQIIERHTVVGDEMLSSIEFPWDVRPMVRSHHERWDGRGYPDGLSGEDIPFTARILHVADVFDALTTTRSYREPLTADQALELMEDDEGSFDPHLLDAFRVLLPRLVASIWESPYAPPGQTQATQARRVTKLQTSLD